MNDDEKLLWELFCTTGEPKYYSMYAKLKSDGKAHGHNGNDKFGE